MTYLDLQTRVKRRVIDLPPAVQDEVPALINEAIRSLQRKYNFRAMESGALFTTTSGSNVLGPIDRFKEYKDEGPYLYKQLTRGQRLITGVNNDINQAVLSSLDQPNTPEFIFNSMDEITGAYTFNLAPFPDTNSDWDDGNYRIIIPFYRYSTKLVNDNDTNWFVDNADDYIISKATGEVFGLDWDYDSMALWLQRAEEKRQEIIKADKTSRLASVDALVPMWRGANQPKVRR